jgi:hypothetical protein
MPAIRKRGSSFHKRGFNPRWGPPNEIAVTRRNLFPGTHDTEGVAAMELVWRYIGLTTGISSESLARANYEANLFVRN